MSSNQNVEWRYGWLCAVLAIVAVCATTPFLEMGVNDDFSYTQIALRLAQSGQLLYNGWNTPMIGLQAFWAALFIKLFGFSFTVVRLSTLPFLGGCSLLLYYLARRTGISRSLSILFTCFVTLSPLAIPLGASFMTDIPALFFLLLCLVASLKALDQKAMPYFALWVVMVAAGGVLGGTVRQIVWLAPAVFLPYVALRRRSRSTVFLVAVCWVGSIAGAMYFSHWFKAQPYTVALSIISTERVGVRTIAANLAGLALEFLVLFIPMMALYLPAMKRLSRPLRAAIISGSVVLAVAFVVGPNVAAQLPDIPFGYFDGNIITKFGVLGPDVEVLGAKPLTLTPFLQVVVLAAALMLFAVCALALWRQRPQPPFNIRRLAEYLDRMGPAASVQNLCVLFTLPYLVAVTSRAVVGQGIDRYLLPLLMIVGLIVLFQRPAGLRFATRTACVLTALFAGYGVATTHDYFACSRARLQAARNLESAHIPRVQITAGLEYDGWTEITHRGFINDSRITNPPDAYQPQTGRSYTIGTPYWFWAFTPSISPLYCITLSPNPHLVDSVYAPVSYTTWLPPFRRKVLIQADPSVSSPGGLLQQSSPVASYPSPSKS